MAGSGFDISRTREGVAGIESARRTTARCGNSFAPQRDGKFHRADGCSPAWHWPRTTKNPACGRRPRRYGLGGRRSARLGGRYTVHPNTIFSYNNTSPPTSQSITLKNLVKSKSKITEQTISSASLLLWACQSSSDGVVEYWRNAFGAEITPALHYSIGFARLDLGRLRGAITRGREKDVGRIVG